jgi:N utilization substance protein A
VAYVPLDEIADIEAFDEGMAQELQTRAIEHLERLNAELDARRRELGVADELAEVPGVTAAMLVAFGENDVKTVEDLAGCATDDLTGWVERRDGEAVRTAGILDGHDVSAVEAEAMILAARIKSGWITQEDLEPAEAADEDDAGAQAAVGAEPAE